jgi:UDP-glucose 4-epimerase
MSAVLDGAPPPSPNEDSCDELNAIVLNATKAAKELGWRPKVGIAEGIRRAIEWLCATLEPEARARRRRPDPYQLYL